MSAYKRHEKQHVFASVYRIGEMMNHRRDFLTGNLMLIHGRERAKHYLHVGIWPIPFLKRCLNHAKTDFIVFYLSRENI
jgi:hypothetical protein